LLSLVGELLGVALGYAMLAARCRRNPTSVSIS
jgi:hypothetical protein